MAYKFSGEVKKWNSLEKNRKLFWVFLIYFELGLNLLPWSMSILYWWGPFWLGSQFESRTDPSTKSNGVDHSCVPNVVTNVVSGSNASQDNCDRRKEELLSNWTATKWYPRDDEPTMLDWDTISHCLNWPLTATPVSYSGRFPSSFYSSTTPTFNYALLRMGVFLSIRVSAIILTDYDRRRYDALVFWIVSRNVNRSSG